MKEQKRTKEPLSRRQFITGTAATVAGLALGTRSVFGAPAIIRHGSMIAGVQIGVISYSFRSLPVNAEQVLQYCRDAGINAIELMGNTAEAFAGAPHTSVEPWVPGQRPRLTQEERESRAKAIAEWRTSVSMDKFSRLKKMYKDAGVGIYAWKPNALGAAHSDAEIDYALRVAKVLGASHVTVELPEDPAHSRRLGELAERHRVGVAYHGHLQQTLTAWDEALTQSRFNGLNCDIGHYVAAGFDPMPLLEQKHERIYSIHMKDRKSKDNGGDNVAWGEGDTPLVPVLQLMKKNKYRFPATIEMEYPVPEGSDAVKEVAKCLEFCRQALT